MQIPSWTEQTRPCNMFQGHVAVDSIGQMWALFWETSSTVLDITDLLFIRCIRCLLEHKRTFTRGYVFFFVCVCARCFCEEHLKLNFNRFALAVTRLACPWTERRPPTPQTESSAPCLQLWHSHFLGLLPFTVSSMLAVSSYSKASWINEAGRQADNVDHLWKYVSFTKWIEANKTPVIGCEREKTDM